MGRLTADEQKALKALQAKAEAPDAPAIGRSLNVSIDLGDEAQVARAIKLGLLDPFDDEPDTDGAGDGDPDDPPRRRGYFTDPK